MEKYLTSSNVVFQYLLTVYTGLKNSCTCVLITNIFLSSRDSFKCTGASRTVKADKSLAWPIFFFDTFELEQLAVICTRTSQSVSALLFTFLHYICHTWMAKKLQLRNWELESGHLPSPVKQKSVILAKRECCFLQRLLGDVDKPWIN